jgi:hypothetical protein
LNSDRGIYAAAIVMINRYGQDAATQAAMRADEFGAENNIEGQRHWILIVITRAIETLQQTRATGETVD